MSELQSGITIKDNKITGTLHYVENYTGFSSIPSEQSGYYLATKYEPYPKEADVHVLKTNGTVGEKVLGKPDLTLISIITDKNKQKLEVYAKVGEEKGETVTYDLSGLTLEPKE